MLATPPPPPIRLLACSSLRRRRQRGRRRPPKKSPSTAGSSRSTRRRRTEEEVADDSPFLIELIRIRSSIQALGCTVEKLAETVLPSPLLFFSRIRIILSLPILCVIIYFVVYFCSDRGRYNGGEVNIHYRSPVRYEEKEELPEEELRKR